jgi:hypothetical protein
VQKKKKTNKSETSNQAIGFLTRETEEVITYCI